MKIDHINIFQDCKQKIDLPEGRGEICNTCRYITPCKGIIILMMVVFILLFAGITGGQEKPGKIPAVAKALKEAAEPGNYEKIPQLAKQAAAAHNRAAIPQLLAAMFGEKPEDGVFEFVARTMIEIADPQDSHGLKTLLKPGGEYLPLIAPELTTAALAALQEKEWLLRIALGKDWDSQALLDVSLYACGFLRYIGDAGTLKEIEEVLKQTPVPRHVLNRNLRGLAASLKYRLEILKSKKDRDAYLKFEKNLWWSLTLTPKGYIDTTFLPREAANRIFKKHGGVDPRFLARILDEAASSQDEKDTAFYLILFQEETTLKDKLKTIAAGDSREARMAEWVLSELEKKKK